MNDTVPVRTRVCQHCGNDAVVEVSREGYEQWKAGAFVQVAFPGMGADVRELLISGTHPQCWIALFGTGEED